MTMIATRTNRSSPNRAGDASKAPGLTGWLQLAAAPTFAALALANALGGPAYMLCSAGHGMASPGGMTLMYALMGLFHAAPWWKLVVASRCGARIRNWSFRGAPRFDRGGTRSRSQDAEANIGVADGPRGDLPDAHVARIDSIAGDAG